MDVDLVVQLWPALDTGPTEPVTAEAFSDRTQRDHRVQDMQVLNFPSDQHESRPVEEFATEPFEFDIEYDNAPWHGR